MKKNVLILCTGNSCRSQMAEALINDRLSNRWQAFSAGTRPADAVHPLALDALAELGIRHQGRPKFLEVFLEQQMDLVITVCDDAKENCPYWAGQGQRVHIGFPDPADATGSYEEKMQVFRAVRDAIEQEILGYLEQWNGTGNMKQ